MIKAEKTFTNAIIGYKGEVVQDIHLPSKNIAIYRRSIEPLETELAGIAAKRVECRASGTAEETLSTLEDYFSSHLPDCPNLFEDISELLRLFEKTSKAVSFRLLLTTVSTNMCCKFHTDMNDLRLLCTYIGPGTLWLPDEAINFKALQSGGKNQDIDIDTQQIQQAQTGDIVILKGALYPDGSAVHHRSPAIEEKGENRLLLRIDTNASLNLFS